MRHDPCECSDPLCPVHRGDPCSDVASSILYRVDMQDETGTRMCEGCADDAFDSGLFTTRDDEEDQEEIDRDLWAIAALGAWDRAVAAWAEGGPAEPGYGRAFEAWLCLTGLRHGPDSVARGF